MGILDRHYLNLSKLQNDILKLKGEYEGYYDAIKHLPDVELEHILSARADLEKIFTTVFTITNEREAHILKKAENLKKRLEETGYMN